MNDDQDYELVVLEDHQLETDGLEPNEPAPAPAAEELASADVGADGLSLHPIDLVIPGGKRPKIDPIVPRHVHAWHKALSKGRNHREATLAEGVVASYAKRSRNLLILFTVLVMACIGVTGGIVYSVVNQRAKAVATVAKVQEFRTAETHPEFVKNFASMFANRIRTWAYYDVDKRIAEAGYFMLPEVRDQVLARVQSEKRSIDRFKRRQQYEEYRIEYHGTSRKVAHKVTVTYRVVEGRGETQDIYKVDRLARRMMFLTIVEGPKTTENTVGLYVSELLDVTEEEVLQRRVVNDWDLIEGKIKAPPKDGEGVE